MSGQKRSVLLALKRTGWVQSQNWQTTGIIAGASTATPSTISKRPWSVSLHIHVCQVLYTLSYSSAKVVYDPETYFSAVRFLKLRTALLKFRHGQHVQLGRLAPVYVAAPNRKCRVCHQECVEDEHHFSFLRPLYADPQKYAEYSLVVLGFGWWLIASVVEM